MSTWVLLRGLMREARHWGDFPAVFAAQVEGALVLTPDFPGNGELHAETSSSEVGEMVEAVRAQLRAAGHAGPYSVLALSLGAMAALEWSVRYPQEITRCVLINTSVRPFSRFYERLRWQNYPAIVGLALRGGAARQQRQEQLILRLTSNRHGGDQALLLRWIAYQREHPVSRSNALRQLLAAARYRAPARPPAAPMLVLCSAADRMVDPACSVRLAEAWQAPCECHPSAGHDLPLDDGPWVAATVARWLGRQAGSAPFGGTRESTDPGAVCPTEA